MSTQCQQQSRSFKQRGSRHEVNLKASRKNPCYLIASGMVPAAGTRRNTSYAVSYNRCFCPAAPDHQAIKVSNSCMAQGCVAIRGIIIRYVCCPVCLGSPLLVYQNCDGLAPCWSLGHSAALCSLFDCLISPTQPGYNLTSGSATQQRGGIVWARSATKYRF